MVAVLEAWEAAVNISMKIWGAVTTRQHRDRSGDSRGRKTPRNSNELEAYSLKQGKAHVAIDPEGNIHQISSLKTFCFHRGLDYHAMRRTRSGKYLHHRGWRCYYELPECIDSPDEFKIKIKQALKNKVKKAKSIQVGNAACAVVDPFGVHYEVTGMKDFCSLHDLDKAEMISVKSGRLPHHRRWRAYPVGAEIPDHEEFWKRHDGKIREMYKNRANTKPKINDWIVTSPNGEISRISNLSRFCKERNLIPANMRQACLMNRLHKGWKIEKP